MHKEIYEKMGKDQKELIKIAKGEKERTRTGTVLHYLEKTFDATYKFGKGVESMKGFWLAFGKLVELRDGGAAGSEVSETV